MAAVGGKRLKYSKLMEDLKEMILSGKIQVGDQLPSENELAKSYAVSRQTVRKALEILQNEGFIYAEHGKGTFCSEMVRHMRASKNIAVVTTYLTDYIFPRVIQGIDEVITREGYSIILKNTRNSRKLEAKCIEELLQKEIDGMIIEPSKSQIYCKHIHLYEKLEAYGIPYVFIQGCFEQMKDKPHVLMDDQKGGYMITKYLIEKGHKHIAGVFKADDSQGLSRHKGYVKALQEAGMPYDPELVIWFYTEDRSIHPYEGTKKLLKRAKNIDAIVGYNDQIACEVIRAVESIGLSVPQDISVTGYDHSYMSSSIGVQLTTIKHPQEKLGEMAADMLLKLIQGEKLSAEEQTILIEPEIVEGNSCRNRKQ